MRSTYIFANIPRQIYKYKWLQFPAEMNTTGESTDNLYSFSDKLWLQVQIID